MVINGTLILEYCHLKVIALVRMVKKFFVAKCVSDGCKHSQKVAQPSFTWLDLLLVSEICGAHSDKGGYYLDCNTMANLCNK